MSEEVNCIKCGYAQKWHVDGQAPGEVFIEGVGIVPCSEWEELMVEDPIDRFISEVKDGYLPTEVHRRVWKLRYKDAPFPPQDPVPGDLVGSSALKDQKPRAK